MSVNAEKSEQNIPAEQTTAATATRKTPQHASGTDSVLALQHAAGNRAVTSLLGDAGRPLDTAMRKQAEARFGERFEDVRVHTSGEAARWAGALGANAWTEGRDIVFAGGKYSPSTSSGRKVLAHELAHVVQQRRGGAKPATFDRASAAEVDAAAAASRFAGGRGLVSVNAASGAGIARQETEEPRWQKRLNPLYQKALKVLPTEGAAALEQANKFAKGVVDKYHVSDKQINQAVETAEPVIQPIANFLGVKSDAPPPKTDEQKEQQSKDVTWLGTPPIDVQLQQRREQQKEQAALNQTDPGALAAPIGNKTPAALPDIFMGPDPEPTDFETELKAGKPFTQTIHPRPDIDPSKGIWLGSGPKPSIDEIKRMSYEDVNHPGARIWVDEGKGVDMGVDPGSVMPIRDPKTHELKGYRMRQGDTMTEFDRNGEVIRNYGLEAPLEHPMVDPIDVAMLGFDLGPVVAKGAAAGGKAFLEWAAKSGTRELAEAGTEEEASALAREFPKIDLGGSPANDVTPFDAPSVKTADDVALQESNNVVDLEEHRAWRLENSDQRAIRMAAGQDFSDETVASAGRSGRPVPVRTAPVRTVVAGGGGGGAAAPQPAFWRKAELSAVNKIASENPGKVVDLKTVGKSNFSGIDVVSEKEIASVKAYDGPTATVRYMNDLQEISGGRGPTGVGSKVSKTVVDLERLEAHMARKGQSLTLPRGYRRDPAAFIEKNTVLRIPDDHVSQVRDAIVRDLTDPANVYGYQSYGLSGPVNAAQARALAARRVKGVGMTLADLVK